MKTYNFKYGHGSVSLSLNEEDILAELHGTETPPISDIRSALFASLEHRIGKLKTITDRIARHCRL